MFSLHAALKLLSADKYRCWEGCCNDPAGTARTATQSTGCAILRRPVNSGGSMQAFTSKSSCHRSCVILPDVGLGLHCLISRRQQLHVAHSQCQGSKGQDFG